MLVLTRKLNERVVIGGNVVVEIVAISGERVRLGITAPPDVPVHRQEVAKEIVDRGGDALRSLARRKAS